MVKKCRKKDKKKDKRNKNAFEKLTTGSKKNKRLVCGHCKKSFKNAKALTNHNSKAHQDKNVKVLKSSPSRSFDMTPVPRRKPKPGKKKIKSKISNRNKILPRSTGKTRLKALQGVLPPTSPAQNTPQCLHTTLSGGDNCGHRTS